MVILFLTCANNEEASKIGSALLETKLVACTRQSQVNSSYWWGGTINHDHEVLLMMESIEEKFDEIEKIVTQLHSYDEYVLTMIPNIKTTPGVERWLTETLS